MSSLRLPPQALKFLFVFFLCVGRAAVATTAEFLVFHVPFGLGLTAFSRAVATHPGAVCPPNVGP